MTRIGGSWQNWGRSASVRPVRVERPRSPEGVQRAVIAAVKHGLSVKAVGAGHSFTGIAVAPGVLLELDDLQGLVSADAASGRVTLLAGTRLHRIPGLLAPYGLAMENLGDIDRQSIAGAISTEPTAPVPVRRPGDQVVGITMGTAAGDFLRIDDEHESDLLPAVALGLGALGIIVEVDAAMRAGVRDARHRTSRRPSTTCSPHSRSAWPRGTTSSSTGSRTPRWR